MNCFVRHRINQIKNNTNQYFVRELPSGYAVMGDYQFYNSYTIFLSKIHATELHQLTKAQRSQFLEDMATTAEAVYHAFNP